jgi:hypothetical protein
MCVVCSLSLCVRLDAVSLSLLSSWWFHLGPKGAGAAVAPCVRTTGALPLLSALHFVPTAATAAAMQSMTTAPPSNGDQQLAEFLELLEQHKKTCEAQGKYIEADIAKKRLEELRQHEENRRDESLRSRQVAQRLGIEEAHMLEFQSFNIMWDRTMKEYEERASELLEAMRQRHELDVHELREKAGGPLGAIKQSPKLLDLRRIEVTLARQVRSPPLLRAAVSVSPQHTTAHCSTLQPTTAHRAPPRNTTHHRAPPRVAAGRVCRGAQGQSAGRPARGDGGGACDGRA